MWLVFAFLSSVFAALTSILAKVGIKGIDSNLATAIRTTVILVMAWGMVFISKGSFSFFEIDKKNWIFLIFSGLATGTSWLFYYKALQMGDVSKVISVDKLSIVITIILSAIFLHEQLTMKLILGTILITAGTFVMIL